MAVLPAGNVEMLDADTCGLKKGTACTVCFEQEGDHVMVPCGHGGFCGGCAHKLLSQASPARRCPLCRVQLTSIVKVPVDTKMGSQIRVLHAYAVAPVQTA